MVPNLSGCKLQRSNETGTIVFDVLFMFASIRHSSTEDVLLAKRKIAANDAAEGAASLDNQREAGEEG